MNLPEEKPVTISEAVSMITSSLSKEDREYINGQKNLVGTHFSIGRYLRNEWSLWNANSPLKRDAIVKYKIAHADDISSLILDWVYAKVRGNEFDPQECVQRFHKHWETYGMTSLEAGGVNE